MESEATRSVDTPFDYTRLLIAYSDKHPLHTESILSALARFAPQPFTEFKMGDIDVKVVQLNNMELSVDEAIEILRPQPQFAQTTFERDARLSVLQAGAANDPYYPQQWALQSIQVVPAWRRVAEAGQGRGPVTVAVVDSGVMSGHQDFNPAKLGGSRVVPPASANYADDVGHGTVLAGIIDAVSNNTLGIAGISSDPFPPTGGGPAVPDVRLLAIKFDDMRNPPSALMAVLGMLQAVAGGAQVINASWHTLDVGGLLFQAIQFLGNLVPPVLVVAAAGNDGSDNTQIPVIPASFGLPNILPVMASDENDDKAEFSNYGANVDIAAPGTRVLSTSIYYVPPPVPPDTIYNPAYREVSGTSVAAAHVTGAAALLLAIDNWTPGEIRDHLVASADPTRGLQGTCRANGRLNLQRAVEGPFAIVSPGGGVPLPRGSVFNVQWTSAYNSPVVNTVEISIRGVMPPLILTPPGGVTNTGVRQVTLPGQAIANAVLRLRCVQKNLYAESAPFDIV